MDYQGRQLIYMDDPADDIDLITLHNILYFIYTDCVNLHLPAELFSYNLPEGYPSPPDPFALYRNAEKFLMPNLKARCYNHLKIGVATTNVCDRLFQGECEHHEALKQFYLDYLLENYDTVKRTQGWEKVVKNEDDVEPRVRRYQEDLLYIISLRLTALPKKELPSRTLSNQSYLTF